MNRILCCAAAFVIALTCVALDSSTASAQCATCAQPYAAYYQPTVSYYQPTTVTYRTGWYPGRFFDRRRARRWGFATAPATTYTTAYTPYTAAYTPYTASYAYTAAYRPYVTAYAPMTRTSFYSVARPVVMSPVASCGTCGCDPCSCNPCGCASPCDCGLSSCDACSSCSSCVGGVSQAIYSGGGSSCSNCAANVGTPSYSGDNVGQQTPRPELAPEEAVPGGTGYDANRPSTDNGQDPGPAAGEASSTFFEAPKLFDPRDRTASRAPTVKIHKAIYNRPAQGQPVSTAPARVVDANGWYAAQ